jgi:hypothetical protein
MSLHQKSPELLLPAAADCATGVRLIKIHEKQKSSITNRPARSIYPKQKSVLTSGTTPDIKTGVHSRLREQHGGHLLTGHAVSGAEQA